MPQRPARPEVAAPYAPAHRYDWARLNGLQLGRYAEYFAKMEFTLFGFDVYTAEVDDKGIDFVIRRGVERHYDVQVKSVTADKGRYIFFPKAKFATTRDDLRENLLAALVLFFRCQPPELFIVPSTRWQTPDGVFVERNYDGLKSKPEWGINISKKGRQVLSEFAFEKMVSRLE
jgi:hypothetical protein